MGKPRDEKERKLKSDFLALRTTDDIAVFFGIKKNLLDELINNRQEKFYETFSIRKKSGGYRYIQAPIPYLRNIQRRVSRCLYLVYKQKAPAHGFCRGKTILTNSKNHERKELIFNLDLNDFFPSISFKRVRGILKANPYNLPLEVADCIAKICCVNNRLPQGAPTSPVLSNMICAKLDNELQMLAIKNRCFYTRYADDITFSTTEKKFGEDIVDVDSRPGAILESLIEENSFIINNKKTRVKTKKQRQRVTGLIVNKFPNVRRDFIRNIRTLIFLIKKYGRKKAQEIFQEKEHTHKDILRTVIGRINFVGFIRGRENETYQKLENSLCFACGIPQKYILDPINRIEKALWVLECDGTCYDGKTIHQGTGFDLEGYGIITCKHVFRCGKIKAFRVDSPDVRFSLEEVRELSENIDLTILKIVGDKTEAHPLKEYTSEVNRSTELVAAGFPSYSPGSVPFIIQQIKPVSNRNRSGIQITLVDKFFSEGMSGGPVSTKDGSVFGVVAGGDEGDNTKNWIIPISYIHT